VIPEQKYFLRQVAPTKECLMKFFCRISLGGSGAIEKKSSSEKKKSTPGPKQSHGSSSGTPARTSTTGGGGGTFSHRQATANKSFIFITRNLSVDSLNSKCFIFN
jgi:hypothetical protein